MNDSCDPSDHGLRRRVRTAWATLLGAEAFPETGRVELVDEDAGMLSVVGLWGGLVVLGPAWAVERTSGLPAERLTDLPSLLSLTADRPSIPLGAATLSYPLDGFGAPPRRQDGGDLDPGVVPDADGELSAALAAQCPNLDVDEAGLEGMTARVVAVDRGGVPLSGAGSVVWADALAHVGVLTCPTTRGRGLGRLVAGAVVDDALTNGLVPQWRAHAGNLPSGAVARALGLVPAGTQTTVRLS